jgi:hypothetical protein
MSASAHPPWWCPSRPWGFRFSRSDLVVVLIGLFVVWHAALRHTDLAILTAFVLGHFFLFCNVFRVGERAELTWGALLLVNVTIGGLLADDSWWWVVLPLQGVATVVVIVLALLSPDYHGAWCQRINPLGYRPEARSQPPSLVRKVLGACRVPAGVIDRLQDRTGLAADRTRTAGDASEV